MQRVLSFEQTPSLSVPLRFFLTAPLFALAAALVLLWHGSDALVSRWTPATLALTHLMTLGFLTMCMIGALLQMLPVVASIEILRTRLTSTAVHALLSLGALALASGFLLSLPMLFQLALSLLLLAFAWLLVAVVRGVWGADQTSPMLTAIRFALAALMITAGLGITLASTFAWPLALPLTPLTDMHVMWGLLGWVGLLVAGVAYQVVPMFQVTPVYPKPMTQWFTKAVFLLLVLWSIADALVPPLSSLWKTVPAVLAACAYALFCGVTFYLLSQRKRPKADATTMFWRTSLASLLAGIFLWGLGSMFPRVDDAPAYPLVIGILIIIGFGYSVVNGMLYKIVPFLVWYHLQNQLDGGSMRAPNVKQVLPDRDAERQFFAHLAALASLLASVLHPQWLAQFAAMMFAISSAWLWLNLVKAARVYRKVLQNKPAATEGAGR